MGVRITSAQLEGLGHPEDQPARKPNRRRQGGARAHKSGTAAETILEKQHALYFHRGLAGIDRLNVPTRPYFDRSSGKNLRIVSGPSGVDFWGVAFSAKAEKIRVVVIELKSTAEPKASIAIVNDRVDDGKSAGAGYTLSQLIYVWGLASKFDVLPILMWMRGSPQSLGLLFGREAVGPIVDKILNDPTGRKTMGRIRAEQFTWLEPGDFDWLKLI